MNIKIHRGTHQIGGCVTEYEYDGWHLFVDYGEELPGGPKTGDLQVEGLTKGDLSKSALLITHYHYIWVIWDLKFRQSSQIILRRFVQSMKPCWSV